MDQDVLSAYRATGAGWQARINAALKSTLARGGEIKADKKPRRVAKRMGNTASRKSA